MTKRATLCSAKCKRETEGRLDLPENVAAIGRIGLGASETLRAVCRGIRPAEGCRSVGALVAGCHAMVASNGSALKFSSIVAVNISL
jgi:hypothetical protein